MSAPARIRVRRISDEIFRSLKGQDPAYLPLEKFRFSDDENKFCWVAQLHGTKKILLLVFENYELVEATEIYDGDVKTL